MVGAWAWVLGDQRRWADLAVEVLRSTVFHASFTLTHHMRFSCSSRTVPRLMADQSRSFDLSHGEMLSHVVRSLHAGPRQAEGEEEVPVMGLMGSGHVPRRRSKMSKQDEVGSTHFPQVE